MYDTIIRYNGSGFHTKVISQKQRLWIVCNGIWKRGMGNSWNKEMTTVPICRNLFARWNMKKSLAQKLNGVAVLLWWTSSLAKCQKQGFSSHLLIELGISKRLTWQDENRRLVLRKYCISLIPLNMMHHKYFKHGASQILLTQWLQIL